MDEQPRIEEMHDEQTPKRKDGDAATDEDLSPGAVMPPRPPPLKRDLVKAPTLLTMTWADSSQQQNNPAGTAAPSNSLFGGATQSAAPTATTPSLFGNSTNNATTTTAGNSLFGGGTATTTAGGGLFGNAGGTTATSGATAGGLFGKLAAPATTQPAGNSLFGTTNTQAQPATTGTNSLFGGAQNTGTSSLFGASQQNNAQPAQATGTGGFGAGTSSLFGGAANKPAAPATNSLFGGGGFGASTTQQPAQNSLFGGAAQTNNTGSIFGTAPSQQQAQPQPQYPSLLDSVRQNKLNRGSQFGSLSMGQGMTAPAAVGAVKVDMSNLRSTTRFEDCIDQVREGLEHVDKLVQQQESFAKKIEAFLPKHSEDVLSLKSDVDFVKDKIDGAEQALITDAQGVEAQRLNAARDRQDLARSERVLTNLQLPSAYHSAYNSSSSMYGSQPQPARQLTAPGTVSGDASYDTDLVGNYYIPLAADLRQTMQSYLNNMVEIESHMRVIEGAAVQQAQTLAARRAGVQGSGGQSSGEETVRELADTLRGFEESILGVAGLVGECREGVNELVLGRLGGVVGRYA